MKKTAPTASAAPEAAAPLFANFRQAMTWVHTWFGLALGFVLMVCFYFGALSVFDREIDRWAIPATRFAPQPMPSFDRVLRPAFEALEPDEVDYALNMPTLHDASQGPMTPRTELPADEYWAYTTHRDPVLRMGAGFAVPHPKDPQGHNHIHGQTTIDPRSGQPVPEGALKIGSDWFYPLHYSLNWHWHNAGYWVVGLAGMAMALALLTGIVMHRKVFREFFTFRPAAKLVQRSALDLHNMTGVLALPFHLFFALTGVLIFAGWMYFPVSQTVLHPLHERHEARQAQATGLPHQRAGTAAPLASVDAMMAEARRRWAARGMPGEVGFLTLHHIGDANGYVSLYRAGSDRVALVGQGIHFQASSGQVLREDPPPGAIAATHEFLTGLHLQHFRHWLLRWLYVIGGLMGCTCIATGFLFFVEKRKKQHAKTGSSGARIVDALATACVTGMVAASFAILVANRLLPADLHLAGWDKGEWEKALFWAAWAASACHAIARNAPVAQGCISPAWREQCQAIAALGLAAALLNWITTGDHLIKTVFTHTYWPVAGVDLCLLTAAAIAAWAARCLRQRAAAQTPAPARKAAHA